MLGHSWHEGGGGSTGKELLTPIGGESVARQMFFLLFVIIVFGMGYFPFDIPPDSQLCKVSSLLVTFHCIDPL